MKRSTERKLNWVPALFLYCIRFAAGFVANLLLLVGKEDVVTRCILLAVPLFVLSIIFEAILHYKCWEALPEQHRKTTPGKAVGFLFIPFYNFYWAFISFPGLAKGYYDFGRRVGDSEIKNMTGLGITYAILFIYSLTIDMGAGLDIVISVADLVIFIRFYRAMSTYANRVLNATTAK